MILKQPNTKAFQLMCRAANSDGLFPTMHVLAEAFLCLRKLCIHRNHEAIEVLKSTMQNDAPIQWAPPLKKHCVTEFRWSTVAVL